MKPADECGQSMGGRRFVHPYPRYLEWIDAASLIDSMIEQEAGTVSGLSHSLHGPPIHIAVRICERLDRPVEDGLQTLARAKRLRPQCLVVATGEGRMRNGVALDPDPTRIEGAKLLRCQLTRAQDPGPHGGPEPIDLPCSFRGIERLQATHERRAPLAASNTLSPRLREQLRLLPPIRRSRIDVSGDDEGDAWDGQGSKEGQSNLKEARMPIVEGQEQRARRQGAAIVEVCGHVPESNRVSHPTDVGQVSKEAGSIVDLVIREDDQLPCVHEPERRLDG